MHQAARAQFENSISNELDIIFNESKRIFQEQEQKKYLWANVASKRQSKSRCWSRSMRKMRSS